MANAWKEFFEGNIDRSEYQIMRREAQMDWDTMDEPDEEDEDEYEIYFE